jgi:hypothetical protein
MRLEAELAAALKERDEANLNLKLAHEREREDHIFFLAALEAVGMKGEVGSLYGLQRQILAKIAALRQQLAAMNPPVIHCQGDGSLTSDNASE